MTAINEKTVRDRLQLMKPNTLYKNGGIRLDISPLNFTENEKSELRKVGVYVSKNDLILTIMLLHDGQHILDPYSSKSSDARDFELSVYDNPIFRGIIDLAAGDYHTNREQRQFSRTQRMLASMGFNIDKPVMQSFFEFRYMITAKDIDLGYQIVVSCTKDCVLEAVEQMRESYALSVVDHLEDADYLLVDKIEYARIKRELLSSKNATLKDSKQIKFRHVVNCYAYVKWSASEMSFVTLIDGKIRKVVEKDGEAHESALQLELAKIGLVARRVGQYGFYSLYRAGSYHKPIAEELITLSQVIYAAEDFVGA